MMEVARELTLASNFLKHKELKKAEGNKLDKTSLGDGIRSSDGGPTIGEGVKGMSDSGVGYDLAKEGKLSDASMHELNVTKAVLLVGILRRPRGSCHEIMLIKE